MSTANLAPTTGEQNPTQAWADFVEFHGLDLETHEFEPGCRAYTSDETNKAYTDFLSYTSRGECPFCKNRGWVCAANGQEGEPCEYCPGTTRADAQAAFDEYVKWNFKNVELTQSERALRFRLYLAGWSGALRCMYQTMNGGEPR